MIVVVKDRLDRFKQNERLGIEAAAAVEADINRLLEGKSYDHLSLTLRSAKMARTPRPRAASRTSTTLRPRTV